MVAAGTIIDPAAGLVKRVIQLQLLPVLLLSYLITWVKAFLLSAVCSPRWERRRLGPLVCVYRNVRGGYHNDVPEVHRGVRRALQVACPDCKWDRMLSFRLFFDDHTMFNSVMENCKSSVGYIVASGCTDPQAAAAEWRSNPAVQQQGLLVGVFPAGECLVGELPNCGPLSYAMCCLRGYTQLMKMVRGGLCTKVPGVLEVHSPATGSLKFVFPLAGRDEMLPF